MLEGFAVRLAMPRIDTTVLRELERQLDAMNDDPTESLKTTHSVIKPISA